jgi:hypothetical protein
MRAMNSGGGTEENANRADCHRLVHACRITRGELVAIVAQREGHSAEEIMDAIWRMRREGKGER